MQPNTPNTGGEHRDSRELLASSSPGDFLAVSFCAYGRPAPISIIDFQNDVVLTPLAGRLRICRRNVRVQIFLGIFRHMSACSDDGTDLRREVVRDRDRNLPLL